MLPIEMGTGPAAAVPPPCPRCGQFDQAQRVPGIVASQYTQLSLELAAPPPPGTRTVRARSGRGGSAGWLVVAALLLLTLPLDIALLVAVLAALAVVGIVAVVVLVLSAAAYAVYRYANRHVIAERTQRERERRDAEMMRYQHALSYWNQLHYCYRCHGVFLPDNPWQQAVIQAGTVAHPAHAWALSRQLADYVERQHAPRIVGAD